MQIRNEPPPNYNFILQFFPAQNYQVFFPYNDTIYNPSGIEIPEDILFHEEIHLKQQNGQAEEWWARYCTDSSFRLQEELQACASQYLWVRKNYGVKSGEYCLEDMAANLASPLYNLDLTENQAKSKIHKRAKMMIK